MSNKFNKKDIITVSVFCLLIAVITVASMVNPVKEYSVKEKRELAQMPKFSLTSLFDGSFTQNYEKFITDQFVARDTWVSVKNKTELLLGKKDGGAVVTPPSSGGQSGSTDSGSSGADQVASAGVYFGKDDYLIGKHEVNTDQLEKNIGFIQKFIDANKSKYNIHTLIAPTASLIISEKLPAFAPVWNQNGLFDRLSTMEGFVDTRDVLEEHDGEEIYYRTDHHWTTLGAYYAYTELCRELGIEPLSLDSFTRKDITDKFHGTLANKVNIDVPYDTVYALETALKYTVTYNKNQSTTTDSIYEMSHLNMGNGYSVFLNENQPLVEINTENKNGKTLVMFKDSYSNCMISMLMNHYENIVLLDLRYMSKGASVLLRELEMSGYEITDVVLLYNAENFTADTTLHWFMR